MIKNNYVRLNICRNCFILNLNKKDIMEENTFSPKTINKQDIISV